MVHVALDIGKNKSQLCVVDDLGGVLLEKRISTTREAIASALESVESGRVLLESSTSSEWIARFITTLGREVIVADPNFGPMYAERTRKVKTDRRDALALAQALRLGAFRVVHRRSDENRINRQELAIRQHLVNARTATVNQLKAILELHGYRLPKSSTRNVHKRAQENEILPEHILTLVKPLTAHLEHLSAQIDEIDKAMTKKAKESEVTQRLMGVVSVGPITALAFAAVVDDPQRFDSARHLAAHTGLVPREYSSSEKQQRGRITRSGDPLLRQLLVQAAWGIVRSTSDDVKKLREWFFTVAERRGKTRAVVGLARRLARILYAMWRDGKEFSASPSTNHS